MGRLGLWAGVASAAAAALAFVLPAAACAGSWTVTQPSTGGVEVVMFGISCPSASLCVAGGSDNTVLSSADPTGGASAWNIAHPEGSVAPPPELEAGAARLPPSASALYPGSAIRGVSCPSAGLCVGVSFQGNIFTSTEPLGGSGAWQVAATGPEKAPHIHMTGVSCASASLCVAVAYAGKILVSTDPAGGGGTWALSQLPEPFDLRGVSCASASLCVAVDNEGNILVSTDPAAGAASWQVARAPAGASSLNGVSCPTASFCVSGNSGKILTSTNPAAGTWQAASAGTGLPITAVSCPSEDACAAVDDNADALVSTDPTGGAGAWPFQNVIPASEAAGGGPNGTFGISCPTVSFCAAIGTRAQIITSTDPFAAEPLQPLGQGKGRRPRVRITAHPAKRVDEKKGGAPVLFRFRGVGAVARFRCSLSGRKLATCRSPQRYRLPKGRYAFKVFAIGPSGLAGPASAFHFRVGKSRQRPPVGSCGPNQPGNTHPCVPTS